MDKYVLTLLGHPIANALFSQLLIEALNLKVKENQKMVENLRFIYDDTIRAFAAAIDAKDSYTRGHSNRVAQYAVAIGKEMGIKGEVLEGFYVAGLLHDVGKIIVDRDMINKKTPHLKGVHGNYGAYQGGVSDIVYDPLPLGRRAAHGQVPP